MVLSSLTWTILREPYRLDSRLTSTGNVCIMLLPNTLKPEKPLETNLKTGFSGKKTFLKCFY